MDDAFISHLAWNIVSYRVFQKLKFIQLKTFLWVIEIDVFIRLNQWHVQWVENGVHRIRAFRAAYGVKKTKLAAEKFRRDLEAAGRVDNRQTDRQARIAAEQQHVRSALKHKMTLLRTKEELIAQWDRYWGLAKYHWDDNHLKRQRKKLGKIVDPKYRPPDIDIKRLRGGGI